MSTTEFSVDSHFVLQFVQQYMYVQQIGIPRVDEI